MRVDTSNESPSSQLSFGVSTSIWLFSCEKHVTVKVVLKTEAAENRSSDSTQKKSQKVIVGMGVELQAYLGKNPSAVATPFPVDPLIFYHS